MGWLQSLLSPLKKMWIRLHSAQNKSNVLLQPIIILKFSSLSLSLSSSFLPLIPILAFPFLCIIVHFQMLYASLSSWCTSKLSFFIHYIFSFTLQFVVIILCFLHVIINCIMFFSFPGRGIYILYEDVKSCPYEDVHVLWSILVESHTPSIPSKQWRLLYTSYIRINERFFGNVYIWYL